MTKYLRGLSRRFVRKVTPCKAGPQGKEGLSPEVHSVAFPRPWCGHLLSVQNPLEGAPSPDIPRQGPTRSQRCCERVQMEVLWGFCCSLGFFLKALRCFNDVVGRSCGLACPLRTFLHVPISPSASSPTSSTCPP